MAISDKQIEKVITLAKEYGATRLLLFGSALEKSAQAKDLDLACDGVEGWKLYLFGAQLEEELGIPLDIVPLDPPSPFTEMIERKAKVLI